MIVDDKGNLHDNKGLFAKKNGVNLWLAGVTEKISLPCKMNLNFFAEKGLNNQTPREIKKGIRNLEKRIEEHEHKIANPHIYWEEWENFDEDRKKREILSWEREIRRFKLCIKYRNDKLKELENERNNK